MVTELLNFFLKIKDITFEQTTIFSVLCFLFYIISVLLKKILRKDIKCHETPCISEIIIIAKNSNSKIIELENSIRFLSEKCDEMTRSNKLSIKMEQLKMVEGLDEEAINRIYDIFGEKQR